MAQAARSRADRDPQPARPTEVRAEADGGEDEPSRRGIAGRVEDMIQAVTRPLDAVLLSRDRIQAVLDDAAERGRITRSDANDLAAELIRLGRTQTEEVLDRARRTVRPANAFPIEDYDELTVTQVAARLDGLAPGELRRIRDYERAHANRKGVLESVERLLG